MTVNVEASGPAAAFCTAELVNGAWALVQTAALPSVSTATEYTLTLTEANDGYANSPHPTNLVVTVRPESVEVTRGTVSVPASRSVTLVLVPPASATGALGTISPYVWQAPFDPMDQVGYAMDWTGLLNGATIADIEAITVSPTAAMLGITIDTSEGRQPMIDTAGELIGLHFVGTGDPAALAFANAGVVAGIAVRVRTSTDDILERTAALTVRQL